MFVTIYPGSVLNSRDRLRLPKRSSPRQAMSDFAQKKPEARRTVNPEAFARLLESLSPDIDEAGVRYARLHDKLSGFFRMKGISDPQLAADETIDRATLKIAAGTHVPEIDRYCLGIARNITKEKYRGAQREQSAFLGYLGTLAEAAGEQVERIYLVLKPCFEGLALDDQNLLVAYCRVTRGRARAEWRRQLAETMNTSVLALRMRVTRLRSTLADCVERGSASL